MYIFYFSLLFVLMELLLLLLLLLPCFCILLVCVCFFFPTRARFVIGLRAVKFARKINWIIELYSRKPKNFATIVSHIYFFYEL
jgi:hypothetical protein